MATSSRPSILTDNNARNYCRRRPLARRSLVLSIVDEVIE